MAWTDNGPVSVPPRPVVYGAALVVALAALSGVGIGIRAAWRDNRPELSGGQAGPDDQAVIARPIVDIPAVEQQAAAANVATTGSAAAADETAASNELAAKTAAAQAIQSKPSQSSGDIDAVMASSSEKPQAPAKPAQDETPPKSDVPF